MKIVWLRYAWEHYIPPERMRKTLAKYENNVGIK
jgi:hypothetical protein